MNRTSWNSQASRRNRHVMRYLQVQLCNKDMKSCESRKVFWYSLPLLGVFQGDHLAGGASYETRWDTKERPVAYVGACSLHTHTPSFYWEPLISRACLGWKLCLFAYRLSDACIKWVTALLITAHQGGPRAAVVCHPTVRQHLLKFWSHMSLENGLCFLRSLSLDDLHTILNSGCVMPRL